MAKEDGGMAGVAATQNAVLSRNTPIAAIRKTRFVDMPFIRIYAINSLDAYAQIPLSLFAKTLSKKVSEVYIGTVLLALLLARDT